MKNHTENMNAFELQINLFSKGAELLPQKVNHLNDILLRLKIALLTLWSAVIGWAITTESAILSIVGFCIILGFLFPDISVRKSQIFYVRQLTEIHAFLNDHTQMNICFLDKALPENLVFPLTSSLTSTTIGIHDRLSRLHVNQNKIYLGLPYGVLAISNFWIFIYLLQ